MFHVTIPTFYAKVFNVLMGLLFQDREMKTTFSAYPEFLCLDATYKLLELGHLMLSEDANGQSEVIAEYVFWFKRMLTVLHGWSMLSRTTKIGTRFVSLWLIKI